MPAESMTAGKLSCAITLEGLPAQRIVATIGSTSGTPLRGALIQLQGDQLFATSSGHPKLQVTLPFGVDTRKAEGQLQGKQIVVKLEYAPLQVVWASP